MAVALKRPEEYKKQKFKNMARYTGPRDKISRRFGVPLFGPSKALERKAYAPGMHGGKRGGRRSKGLGRQRRSGERR